MILKDGSIILLDTINNKVRHQDYCHVIELAKNFTIYATGKGIEEKLKRFNGGETVDLFDQRVILTVASINTPDIFNSCVKPLRKVGRTPASIKIQWTGKDKMQTEEKKKQLNEISDKFWGSESVEQYLTKRMPTLDSTDPNSFIVVDFKESVDPANPDTKANPYPVEVNSAEAINYQFVNNTLQWLTVLNNIWMLDDKGVQQLGEKYFMYLDNENITATQIHSKTVDAYLQANPNVIRIDDENPFPEFNDTQIYLYSTKQEGDAKRYYEVRVFSHKIGFVPAKRVGTELDENTRGRTCVPVVDPAKSYFEDSIQTMSEFSITKRLHTFPKLWQYLPKCDACYKGKVEGGKDCGKCKGSGTVTHESSQDIVGIRMPDSMEDLVDLQKLSHYAELPIELLKFQKEFGYEDIRRYALSAVYNNEIGRKQGIKTATETEINFEAVYDAVKSFADHWSEMYVFIQTCNASIRDLGEGFHISHKFPNDFKMETFTSLLEDLGKANTSGAPSHVKKAIINKINNKIYVDQQRELLKLETQDKFQPFIGKTENEILFLMANGKVPKKIETLWSMFDLIFSEIEYESNAAGKDFYQMDESLQKVLIDAKVTSLNTEIEKEAADAAAKAFKMAPDTGITA